MTTDDLTAALRACASGLYHLEAGVALLVGNGTFLRRDDFTSRFISHGTSGGTPMAAVDWNAAITALASGDLPCSGGERHHPPGISQPRRRHPRLREAITGLDHDNPTRLLTAIRAATRTRTENS